MVETQVNQRGDEGEDYAGCREGRHGEQKDGVAKEVVEIGSDEKQAGENEGREEGEEARVPEAVGIEADCFGGAEAEGESGHQAKCCENSEGGKEEMAGVEEVGVHVRGFESRDFRAGFEQSARAKTKCRDSSLRSE